MKGGSPVRREPMEREPAPAQEAIAVVFDFERKLEHRASPAEAKAAVTAGQFVWLDIDRQDSATLPPVLDELDLLDREARDDLRTGSTAARYARYPNSLRIVLTGCRVDHAGFRPEPVEVIIGPGYLLTVHRGEVSFLEKMRREYREDFLQHAETPSFLVYELWDHLVENYVGVQAALEERVELLQHQLTKKVDEEVFSRLGDLAAELMHFRKILVPARAVLGELATRKSRFISEASQPFLANISATLERVLQDLLTDREILSETLNLNMSMMAHRTNEVVRRLTLVNFIFLPLAFLTGVYGMNFRFIPGLNWAWGFPAFWIAVLAIVIALVLLLRKIRLL